MSATQKANIVAIASETESLLAGQSVCVRVDCTVSELVFDLDCLLEWIPLSDGNASPTLSRHLRQDAVDVSWLPPGGYQVTFHTPCFQLSPGPYRLVATLFEQRLGESVLLDRSARDIDVGGVEPGGVMSVAWDVRSAEGTPDIADLSWNKGHDDWFFRHFDHAARTIISYMLGDSPLLRGRVLDVGCGDGITDLGVCLRCQPEMMIGVDPFRGYERLFEVTEKNHLPLTALPPNLRFEPADANELPFKDDSFDVVLSWGSLEHIAGGYDKALKEIRRVLKNGGLFFVHPGLYYSNYGHHLGEFSDEPFFHLTKTREELEDLVLNTPPKYMDRAGEFSSPQQYWQWYNELNPMTVRGFEQELKELGFEFYRAALRTEDLIEYHHPNLQNYPMEDLATVELYLSAWNRK